MRNIKLVIEYDGTNYQGWQVQPNGPTVQEELETAIRRITGEQTRIAGAGRTDAGVHAVGQVACFFTSSGVPVEKMRGALNGVLPPDIVILEAEEVDSSFHARYSARSKLYRYTVLNRDVPPALERKRALFIPFRLDPAAMKEAGKKLVGTNDYSSFGCNAGRDDNPIRTVLNVKVFRDGDYVIIEIEAVSFLYKMVRSIVGTLIDVGRGKVTPPEVEGILEDRDRCSASATAPAHGLCLMKVSY